MKLTILPSDKGDCLILQGKDGSSILIDGGTPESYRAEVRAFWASWTQKNGGTIDLAYVSHIDQDHIGGMLQMFDDIASWRVYDHQKNDGGTRPAFPRPPTPRDLWHNSFHDQVGRNSGPIESMLAASAASLSNSTSPAIRDLARAYQEIATSIPEAIRLSRRASPQQLGVPLNRHFGGRLGMVRTGARAIRMGSLTVSVIGPFSRDLDALRDEWNTWLDGNEQQVERLRKQAEKDERLLGSAAGRLGLGDEELGNRGKVTTPNLASLMLLVEEDGKRVVLTGDGHHAEVERGLEAAKVLKKGAGAHVDVLKVQHHGSEHNTSRDFARRLTADHYIFCGNGEHQNPDLRVLKVYLESRVGTPDQRSKNPEAARPFTVWFSAAPTSARADRAHMEKVEALMKGQQHAHGAVKVRFRKKSPLELAV
ncbi:MAG: hypothetical protein U0637_10875 [Phycisphaerales bacterium]